MKRYVNDLVRQKRFGVFYRFNQSTPRYNQLDILETISSASTLIAFDSDYRKQVKIPIHQSDQKQEAL